MISDQQLREIFNWPTSHEVPAQRASELYKDDPLLRRVEGLVGDRKAWAPITGGTKRTEQNTKLARWLGEQNRKGERLRSLKGLAEFRHLDIDDFPAANDPNKRIVSTSKNIIYLIDKCEDFKTIFQEAFPSQPSLGGKLDSRIGVLLYVTNSVTSSGRAFSGDPFTGQITAYSKIFATDIDNVIERNIVAYYPHQLFSQLYSPSGAPNNSKGMRVLEKLATLLIMSGGIPIDPVNWEVIK